MSCFFSVSIKQIIISYTQIWKNKLLTLLRLLSFTNKKT
ncbi:hypothetical protein GYO_1759 [Bacillus spizizenii TU-B-10]|uniref:Uncharacterized protein n=1 Tax=Bacillus spizizenii (strain DSM 15029 / JCM 12233 / NBRC 101239 / NRRL B-23049 / TU-B-10) TaxID=1052585 RepID=G4NVP1_BACS4|nr:hypothetical protein GYO_1759 [Bacillus spizizenii TU-B-10]SCV40690.1 hypothetical protein BQ1740_1816 [Bacillus subtilis]